MIVALPFCAKDGHLAIKNLNFCIILEGTVPVDALLSYDTETPPEITARVRDLAMKYFRSVKEHQYYAPSTKGWPQAANHAFQYTARHIVSEIKQPFLWWEADAVPLRKGWLTDIEAEYAKALAANKCFMGHLVQGIIPGGHMNGVGVYPADVGRFSRNAMLAMNAAWDVSMAKQMLPYLYPANQLFQHVWSTDENGNPSNGGKDIPTFKDWKDVTEGPHRVDFRAALYHRCKDGSIINHYLDEAAAKAERTNHSAATALSTMPGKKTTPRKSRKKDKRDMAGEDCRILIVTYYRDFQWLQYCLKAIKKFGRGFAGVTVAIPRADMDTYAKEIGARDFVRLHCYDEVKGKGMVQHMERIGMADEICGGSKFILHVDSDVIFKKPFTPADYIDSDGKPYYVVRSYKSLINEKGVISDCYQWKPVAERALGEEITMYTMCRHPTCFPREFYAPFREHIERVQKVSFRDYVLAQENKFPQTFAEFPSMGAWAWAHMHDRFNWIVLDDQPAPEDLQKTYWSHAGIEQTVPGTNMTAKQEMEAMLK